MTRKGLVVTLLTVTFAFLRVSAFANAPVVTDPGDVIVGDLEQGAANNVFVFPDAFDLDAIVSDDTTADSAIKWTYTASDGKYTINGVAPLDLLTEDPDAPPAGKRLDGNDLDTAVANDGQAHTVTIRNNDLSPGPGVGPYAEPATTGILAAETRTITLFASDCTTHSSVSIVVYTANNTSDSISGNTVGLTPVRDDNFDQDPSLIAGWFGAVLGGTGSTGTATGLCMWVPLNNTAAGAVGWLSPPNVVALPSGAAYFDLADKTVYRIRLSMYCDQTGTGAQPFWTFGYNNAQLRAGLPGNTYGGDLWTLDVAGGANGIKGPLNARTNGLDTYDYWYAPIGALTDQWRGVGSDNTGPYGPNSAFDPSVDGINDMNLIIRILDGAQGGSSIHNEADTGTVCVRELRVDSINIDALASRTSDAYVHPITFFPGPVAPGLFAVNPDGFSSGGNGTGSIDNATNSATFSMGPNYAGGGAANTAGGRKSLIFYDPAQLPAFGNKQFFPIQWVDGQLLQLKAGIRSGVGGGGGSVEGTDPVDVLFINFITPTSEIGGFNFTQKSVATNMFHAGSPRLKANTGGVTQTYTAFFYTQQKTQVDPLVIPDADRVQGYVDFINNASLGTATDGRDPVTVDSMGLYAIDITGF